MDVDQNKCTIRDAIFQDATVLAGFNGALAFESEHRRLDPQVALQGVERALREPTLARYFVAECDGHVVGQTMITWEWSDWRAGMNWWIQSVYVRPEFRGRGIFRALYQHIEALARNTPEVCGLKLYVEHENQSAMATYERLGMKPSGHLVYQVDLSSGD